jgi:MFS family permease
MKSINNMPLNVYLLALAQAFVGSVGSMVVFIGGLIGADISPNKKLATLPLACIIIGTALSTIPVSLFMKKVGRKRAFFIILIFSMLLSFAVSYSVYIGNFYLFCSLVLFYGITNATVMQFRFTAMESVRFEQIPKSTSTVLLGGLFAAYLGPEFGLFGKDLLNVPYAGSFLLLSGLFFCGLIVFIFFKNTKPKEIKNSEKPRDLKIIIKQPVFLLALTSAAIGYAIMSFIMTATPISMHKMDGHSIALTKNVIQSHIVAMFLPSLFTAWIIKKIGIPNMLLLGLLIYSLCVGFAYFGQDATSYWIALILLGLGWNFLFIGGTSLLPNAYHASERFKVQALNDFLIFGIQAIAALTAGSIIFNFGWQVLLLIVIPFIILQAFIVIRWKSKY